MSSDEEGFLVSKVLREALNLEKVPYHSTICKAVKRLREDLRRSLEESSKLLEIKLKVLAIKFRWLFCRIVCLYGKRWMVETVFSVIKDSVIV